MARRLANASLKRRQAIRLSQTTDLTNAQIAEHLGVSVRTLYTWLTQAYEVTPQEAGGFLTAEDWSPVVRACMEDSPDGFQRFFNRYSGMKLRPHSRRMIEAAWGKTDVLINVPPNHAKSTVFSVWLSLWRVARDRSIRIIVLSQTDRLAKKFTSEIAAAFQRPLLTQDFGRFKPKEPLPNSWVEGGGLLRVEGSPWDGDWTYIARGAGQQVQGLRADLVVADDVSDPKAHATDAARRQLSEWFAEVVTSRLEPNGSTWVIGTRNHPGDLYGELSNQRLPNNDLLYSAVTFPALSDPVTGAPSLADDAVPLWPHDPADGPCRGRDCRDRKFLELQRTRLGRAKFAQTYQQEPLPADSALVPPEWFYGTEGRPGCVDHSRITGRSLWEREECVRYVSIDPSAGAGYIGWHVADLRRDSTTFEPCVITIGHRKGGLREFVLVVDDLCSRYGPIDYLIWEAQSAFNVFAEDLDFRRLVDHHHLKEIRHLTSVNKNSQESGLSTVATTFEFGHISIPYGDVVSKMEARLLGDEATNYPFARTTDVLMSVWFAKYNFERIRPRSWQQPRIAWGVPSYLRGQKWVNA